MSIFNWLFPRKPPVRAVHDSSGLPSTEATRPVGRVHAQRDSQPQGHAGARSTGRKGERVARRELLYTVVRECMARAGVLSSGYKFKVLSLDPRGRQFLIMVDLARGYDGTEGSLPEIEVMIAQAAKSRHDIVVTAVYWRMIDHVSVGAPARPVLKPHEPVAVQPAHAAPPPLPAVPAAVPVTAAAASAPEVPASPDSPFDPIRAEEVAAFRRALAAGSTAPAKAPVQAAAPAAPAHALGHAPGPDGTHGRHPAQNYALLTGFEDTELPETEQRERLLSGTQYGQL